MLARRGSLYAAAALSSIIRNNHYSRRSYRRLANNDVVLTIMSVFRLKIFAEIAAALFLLLVACTLAASNGASGRAMLPRRIEHVWQALRHQRNH